MLKLKRVLFPTDFSTNSKVAQDYACELAKHFHAELHILYVLQEMLLITTDPGQLLMTPTVDVDAARKSAEQALERLPDAGQREGLTVVRATGEGSPFVEIVRYARENDIDLIVLGTHGRTGLKHVFLGSVAENVVRKASCPVLTIRPTDHKFVQP